MSESGSVLDESTIDPRQTVEALESELVTALTIAYHPSVERIGERALLARGGAAGSDSRFPVSRLHPLFAAPRKTSGKPLAEAHISRRPSNITVGRDGTVTIEPNPEASKLLLDGEPLIEPRELAEEELDHGVLLELGGRVLLLVHRVNPLATGDEQFGLAGESVGIVTVRRQINRIAQHDIPVLLRGETGTGKELIAKAIHDQSQRSDGSFVAVNMAAIPATTAASSLFGHARGAFTGAVQASAGYFGQADDGTLFLDEIADTPADIQPALLRALESGEVQAVGETRTRQTNVRIIAATDANLEEAVEQGRFRLPLLQRLAGYELFIAPLRERREDIPRLLVHFLREELAKVDRLDKLAAPKKGQRAWLPRWFVSSALDHPWPGNVRQLRNAVRQLAIEFADVSSVERTPFVTRLLSSEPANQSAGESSVPPPPKPARTPTKKRRLLRDISDEEVLDALRRNGWRPGQAAEELGVARSSIYALMNESPNIRKAADLDVDQIRAQLDAVSGDVAAAAAALEVSERGLRLRMKQTGME